MKFKSALIFSLILHISAFSLALFQPDRKSSGKEMTYYVDLIEAGGGRGAGSGARQKGNGTTRSVESVRKLRAIGQESEEKGLRYPTEESEKQKKGKELPVAKKEELSVVKKEEQKTGQAGSSESSGGDGLRTGLGIGGSGTGSGGTGSGSGSGSGIGSGYFPYAYYVDILKNRVSTNWYSGMMQFKARGKYYLVIFFKIQRNGQISEVSVEKSSGISELDLSALRAVQQAAPFPPLPRDFADDYLIVHLEFFWEQ